MCCGLWRGSGQDDRREARRGKGNKDLAFASCEKGAKQDSLHRVELGLRLLLDAGKLRGTGGGIKVSKAWRASPGRGCPHSRLHGYGHCRHLHGARAEEFEGSSFVVDGTRVTRTGLTA